MIRSLGNLEKYSAVRHDLGYYRSVACTARYFTDDTSRDLCANIEAAIVQTILKHPVLRCGIINEDGNDPSFVRLTSIDLTKCVNYGIVTASSTAEYEKKFTKILENQHNQLWPELERRPGWKVIVVQSEIKQPQKIIDIIFSFHHSLADGLSGRAFHATLQTALNSPRDNSNLKDHVLTLPDSINLVPSVEQLVTFKLSWLFFLKEIWGSIKPAWLFPVSNPPWAGASCSLPSKAEYSSRVQIISIPADCIPKILAHCRNQKTTITGLLHGLILKSLSLRLPKASSFAAATPYSLRALSGSTADDMCSQTSSMSSTYGSDLVTEIRNAAPESELLTDKVWEVARSFKTSIAAELARLPNDNVLGLLPYVSDMHKYFTSMLGKPRTCTFEVSNINSFTNTAKEAAKWRVERLIFTQCGPVVGAAMSFNVASVTEGPLTISVTWQEGIVEEEFISAVTKDVEHDLLSIGRTKVIL